MNTQKTDAVFLYSILNLLQNGQRQKAINISKSLKVDKRLVQKALYSHVNAEFIDIGKTLRSDQTCTPPEWYLEANNKEDEKVSSVKKDEKEPVRFVMIDGGNVHDVLQHAEKYADGENTFVYFFADMQTNCYGCASKPCKNAYVRRLQAKSAHTNAADVEIIWEVCRLSYNFRLEEKKVEFYIVTKDQQFQHLKTKVEELGHTLTFCNSWEELRIYIE